MSITTHDIRTYPSGAVVNSSVQDWDSNLGWIAEHIDRAHLVWVAWTTPVLGGEASTHDEARDGIRAAWEAYKPTATTA